jgi:hypothetical protein
MVLALVKWYGVSTGQFVHSYPIHWINFHTNEEYLADHVDTIQFIVINLNVTFTRPPKSYEKSIHKMIRHKS